MKSLFSFLSGKKTYIGTILMGAIGLSWSMGWIDDKMAAILGTIVGTLTGVAIRAAIEKSGPPVPPSTGDPKHPPVP